VFTVSPKAPENVWRLELKRSPIGPLAIMRKVEGEEGREGRSERGVISGCEGKGHRGMDKEERGNGEEEVMENERRPPQNLAHLLDLPLFSAQHVAILGAFLLP